MDVSNILSTMNLVLWILLGAFVVLLVLFFLRGLARGWRYGLYRFISFAVFIAIALSTLRVTANAVGNWDMTSFHIGPFSKTIDVNGTPTEISLVFGSPYSAISGAIQQIFEAYQVNASPDDVANYANSLGQSTLMLLLISVEALLLMTIINLLIMIMWHVLWKRFIPKEKRKQSYKQGKIWGAFSDLVIGIVCCCMFIYPLTSIVNTFAYSYSKATEETDGSLRANSTTADTVAQVVDSYENSTFAKIFFSWTRNNQGLTFDAALTNYLTVGDYNGASVSFVNELSSLTKAFSVALQSGLLGRDSGSEGLSNSYLACSYYMPVLMESLAQSGLLNGLAPYAIQVASNISGIRQYLQTDAGLSISSDFSTTASLTKLAELYRNVLDSGLAGSTLDADGNVVGKEDIVKQAFSGATATPMEDLLEAFDSDDLKLFNTIIASAAYCMSYSQSAAAASNPDAITLADFTPKLDSYDSNGDGIPDAVPDSFLNFQWGHEVAVFYDCIVRLIDIDPQFFDLCYNAAFTDDHPFDTAKLYSILANNPDKVGEVFYGGTSADDTLKSFLDSRMLENALSKIFTILQDSLNNAFQLSGTDAINLGTTKTALLSDDFDTQVKLMKEEFRALFNIVKKLVANAAGVNFLSDLEGKPGLYFDDAGHLVGIDDNLVSVLADSLEVMDNSKLATAFIPPIFDHFLGSDSGLLPSAGLSLSFKGNQVGHSLAEIIRTYGKCQELVAFAQTLGDTASSGTALKNQLSTLVGYSDELLTFLTMMVENPILNPVGSSNSNLYGIVNALIKATLGDYSAELKAAIESNNFSPADEMKTLVQILKDLQSSDVLSKMDEFSSSKNISVLNSVDFTALMADVQQSDIIKSFLGSYLDSKLSGSGLFEEGDLSSTGISFTHVTQWEDEGVAITALIKAASSIGDLANIDFLNSDPDAVTSIISTLAKSQIFTDGKGNLLTDSKGNYLFSSYISKKLVTSISKDSGAAGYFSDYGTSSGNYTFNTLSDNIASLTQSQWLTTSGNLGEADTLGEMIYRSSRMGSFNGFGSGDLRERSADDIMDLLDVINDSRCFAQVVTYHIYEKMNQSLIDGGSTAFSHTNLEYLYNTDKAGRAAANTALEKLVHVILDPSGVDSSGNLTYTMLDSNGALKSNGLSLQSSDPNHVIKPLLQSLAESQVFNTLKTGDAITAFQSEMVKVIVDSGLYGSGTSVETNVTSYVQKVETGLTDFADIQTAWDAEIGTLCQCVSDLNTLGISDFSSFSFDSLFKGTEAAAAEDEVSRANVESLLSHINSSKVLFRCLPYQMDKAMSNASSTGDFTLTGGNSYYKGTDDSYGDDEITTLSYILMKSKAVKTLDASDLSTLSSWDIGNITTMLAKMDQSHVFNSLPSGSTETLTLFQKNMKSILTKDSRINDLLYSTSNPKDIYLVSKNSATTKTYTDAASKADYLVLKDLPAIDAGQIGTTYPTTMIDGDSGSLKAVLNVFSGHSEYLTAMSSGSSSGLSSTGIASLLTALNQCDLLHDCVPNVIAKMATSTDVQYGGLNFDRANAYFCYYYNSDGSMRSITTESVSSYAQNYTNGNYNIADTYPDGEISVLSSFLTKMNNAATKNLLSNISSTAITQESLLTLRSVLYGTTTSGGLGRSYVFHLGGAYQASDTLNSSGIKDNLTVFEQTMFKIYSDSKLSDLSFAAYSTTPSIQTAYGNSSATMTHDYIIDFNAKLSAAQLSAQTFTHSGNWETEINNFICNEAGDSGFLELALQDGLLTSGANFDSTTMLKVAALDSAKKAELRNSLQMVDIVSTASSAIV